MCLDPAPRPTNQSFHLHGTLRLLTVARLDASEKYKGIEMVIDAMARLRRLGVNAHYNIVGDGNDRQRLERYVIDNGCAERVTFWGQLNDSDLQAAYQSATLFVMPSLKEGFGIVFLEALRHGVPCIGGAHGGTPEVIEDGETGFLVEYGDVDSLTGRIELLLKDADLRAKMSANAKTTAAVRFPYEAFSNAWRHYITGFIGKVDSGN